MRFSTMLGALLGVAFTAVSLEAQRKPAPKAHAHGLATLDIAIEGKTGQLRFVAPAEDVYGFERAPRTPAERQKRDAALATLRTRFAELVIFEAALGCRITNSSLKDIGDHGAGHDHADEGGHAEVTAEFALACTQAPAGKDIRFGITRAFPSIRTVQVQLVSDTQQQGLRVQSDRGTVRP